MAFRADESIKDGAAFAERYLLSKLTDLTKSEQECSRQKLMDLMDILGPVVDFYPAWHPLLIDAKEHYDIVAPNLECGYKGLDHTVLFANGFITCPYDDGQTVLDSVANLSLSGAATIFAERLKEKLYNSGSTVIVVYCQWNKPLCRDGTIPPSLAAPLLLEKMLPYWESSKYAETWNSMSEIILGKPHGKRSSLLVNQETGLVLKKLWESLINTGMYGPIQIRS